MVGTSQNPALTLLHPSRFTFHVSRFTSIHRHAAVDVQDLAGDVGGEVGCQEEDGVCYVVRVADALGGDGLEHGIFEFLGEDGGDVGLYEAGGYGVGGDVAAGDLAGDGLGEADQTGL